MMTLDRSGQEVGFVHAASSEIITYPDAAHHQFREACGLPEISDIHCYDGAIKGNNPIITDLKCNFSLTAVVGKTAYHMDLVDLIATVGFSKPQEKGFFFSRWAETSIGESPVRSFSIRKGELFGLITDKHLKELGCKSDCEHLDQLSLIYLMNPSGHGLMLLGAHLKGDSYGFENKVTRYGPRLQYGCIDNQPELVLLAPKGGMLHAVLYMVLVY